MSPHDLAMTIIRDVLKTTGITATAGIGSNLYLAKMKTIMSLLISSLLMIACEKKEISSVNQPMQYISYMYILCYLYIDDNI